MHLDNRVPDGPIETAWDRHRFNQWRRYFAMGFAAIIVIGNCSFPIAVMTGLVDLPK